MDKDLFTVGELSVLTGISKQTIRYYDKIGLLKPAVVTANAYRYYEPLQIITLNMIMKLSQLNCSLKEIKQYLYDENIGDVAKMLALRQSLVEDKLKELLHARKSLQSQIDTIERGLALKGRLYVEIKSMKERRFFYRSGLAQPEKKAVIVAINSIMKELDHQGSTIVGSPVICWKEMGGKRFLQAGFFADEQFCCMGLQEQALPSGDYACICHHGSYENTQQTVNVLQDELDAQNLSPLCDAYHLFVIDYALARSEEELLTEIQVRVGPKK